MVFFNSFIFFKKGVQELFCCLYYFFWGAEATSNLGWCVQYRGHLREGPINGFVPDTVQK